MRRSPTPPPAARRAGILEEIGHRHVKIYAFTYFRRSCYSERNTRLRPILQTRGKKQWRNVRSYYSTSVTTSITLSGSSQLGFLIGSNSARWLSEGRSYRFGFTVLREGGTTAGRLFWGRSSRLGFRGGTRAGRLSRRRPQRQLTRHSFDAEH